MWRRPETLCLLKEHRPRAPALWLHFTRTDGHSKLCQTRVQSTDREGLLETVQGCLRQKYNLDSMKGAKYVSVMRGQEREKAEGYGCRVQQPRHIHYRTKTYSPHCLCALTDDPRANRHIPHRLQKSRRYRDPGTRAPLPARGRPQCVEASLRPALYLVDSNYI